MSGMEPSSDVTKALRRRGRTRPAAAVLLVLAVLAAAGATPDRAKPAEASQGAPPKQFTVESLSDVYTIDKIYRSMMGPESSKQIKLLDVDPPELLWITGYRTEIVGADGKTPMPAEFMCHSNLDLNASEHASVFGRGSTHERAFTISQGQLSISFPRGFGLPVLSSETLTVATQVLNLNEKEGTRQVRHKVSIDAVRDRDLEEPYQPLRVLSAFALVSLDGKPAIYQTTNPSELQKGSSCLPGEAVSHQHDFWDSNGHRFTGHFLVEPGRHVYKTLVTKKLALTYDTTIHTIAVHLHPFAVSLELKDLTSGKSVYKAYAKGPKHRIGLEHVDTYSSKDGLPLFMNHEYELEAIYDNTSGETQDSMAVMWLYCLDKLFTKPALRSAEPPPPAPGRDQTPG